MYGRGSVKGVAVSKPSAAALSKVSKPNVDCICWWATRKEGFLWELLTINGPIHNYEPSDGLGIKCYLSIYVFECFLYTNNFWYLQKHFELIFELKRTYVRYILFDDSNAIRASIESTLKHRVFHFFSLLKNWDLIRHTGKLLRVAKSYFYMVENINSNLKWYLSVYRMSMAKMWEIHLSVSRFLRLTKYALFIFL